MNENKDTVVVNEAKDPMEVLFESRKNIVDRIMALNLEYIHKDESLRILQEQLNKIDKLIENINKN